MNGLVFTLYGLISKLFDLAQSKHAKRKIKTSKWNAGPYWPPKIKQSLTIHYVVRTSGCSRSAALFLQYPNGTERLVFRYLLHFRRQSYQWEYTQCGRRRRKKRTILMCKQMYTVYNHSLPQTHIASYRIVSVEVKWWYVRCRRRITGPMPCRPVAELEIFFSISC